MRLQQRTSRKSHHLLVALTLVFWWSGYFLLHYKTEVSTTSGDSPIAEDAAIVAMGECRSVANNGRRIVPINPANRFPRPTKSQVCGEFKVFFLSLSRKPRPDNVPAPASIIALIYQVKDSDGPPPLVAQRRPFHRLDAYLRHCALLI
jgi:hypothetical protein